jgi:hypothetical protein
MSDLPADNPYAKFRPAEAAPQSDNPYAKFRAAPPVAAPAATKETPSIAERLWNTASSMVQAPARFAQGVAEGVAGEGIPEGRASQFEGGAARFGGRAIGTGGRSIAESLWNDVVKPQGKMLTGEMQPGPEAEAAARGTAMMMAGMGGWAPGKALPGLAERPPGFNLGGQPPAPVGPVGGGTRLATVQMPSGPPRTVQSPPLTPEQMPPAPLAPAAPAETSALGDAIATNSSGAVDNYITRKYRIAVKPSKAETRSAPELAQQDQRILTTVDQIIANRGNLRLTDAVGNEIAGRTPRSLRQFSEAVDQTKKSLFQKYDAMARQAGDVGVQVDLEPVISELRSIGMRPEVIDLHPELAPQIETLARNFEARGFYSPSAAQDAIENINKMLSAFYKNPTEQTVSRATLLAPIARTLRGQLDAAIEGATGPGYQALRQQYGALSSVEKDIAKAVQREANKLPGGLMGAFADAAASEEAIRGIFTMNPAAVARAGGIRAARQAVKYVNDPNRAIERLFERRMTPPGPPTGLAGPAFRALQPAMGDRLAQPQRDPDRPLRSSVGGP